MNTPCIVPIHKDHHIRFKAYLELALSMLLAGSSVIISKFLTQTFPVFLASCLGLLVALIVLIPLNFIHRENILKIDLRTAAILFLQGFSGTFLFRVFLFYGLKNTSASQGGLITSTAPAMVVLLAFLMLKEKVRWNKISGILLTVAGIMIINFFGAVISNDSSPNPMIGNFLIFLAVIGEALFSIFSKMLGRELSPIFRTTLVCLFGFICFIPFSIYEAVNFNFVTVSYKVWLSILYYGLVITVLSFILWFKGIASVPASSSAALSGLMPVSSLLLSGLFLKESITPIHILSLVLIVSGILLTTLPSGAVKSRPFKVEIL